MSNEELYHARLDRLLDAITNKEVLIEVQKEKIQTLTEENKILEQQYKDDERTIKKLVVENKRHSTPTHETVSEWENRTGESYPDDAPCWVRYTFNESCRRVKPYWGLVEYEGMRDDTTCIVANHHGKPEE